MREFARHYQAGDFHISCYSQWKGEMALKEYLRTYRLTVEMYLEIVQQVAGVLKGMLDRCIVNTELW